jgi:hypothetical protein
MQVIKSVKKNVMYYNPLSFPFSNSRGYKMKTKILFTAAVFLPIITTSFAQEKISTKDAAKYVGQTVIVLDTVTNVYLSKTWTYFMNMGGEYPDNDLLLSHLKAILRNFMMCRVGKGKVVEVTRQEEEY